MSGKDIFSAEDVVKIAVEIEKRGRDFYSSLIDRFDDAAVVDIFRTMTTEETKHEQLFSAFLQDFKNIRIRDGFNEERGYFMEALASAHIFINDESLEQRVKKIKTSLDAIDLAIEFEKDSVVYFTGMKEYVFEDDQGIIDSLAKEEMLHVVRLLDMKNEVLKS